VNPTIQLPFGGEIPLRGFAGTLSSSSAPASSFCSGFPPAAPHHVLTSRPYPTAWSSLLPEPHHFCPYVLPCCDPSPRTLSSHSPLHVPHFHGYVLGGFQTQCRSSCEAFIPQIPTVWVSHPLLSLPIAATATLYLNCRFMCLSFLVVRELLANMSEAPHFALRILIPRVEKNSGR